MRYVSYNLNCNILVKLDPEGYVHWMRYKEAEWARVKQWLPECKPKLSTLEDYKAQADVDGYVEFQAWQFIAIFGPVTSHGTMHYSAQIKLEAEYVEQFEG